MLVFLTMVCCSGPFYREYRFPQKGFAVRFPAKWTVKQDYRGTDVMVLIPSEKFSTPYRENFNIIREELKGQVDVDEYTREQVKSIQNSGILRDCVIEKRGEMTLYGRRVPWYVYRYRIGGFTVRSLTCVVHDGNTVFLLTGITEYTGFEKYEPVFMKIVKGFELL